MCGSMRMFLSYLHFFTIPFSVCALALAQSKQCRRHNNPHPCSLVFGTSMCFECSDIISLNLCWSSEKKAREEGEPQSFLD